MQSRRPEVPTARRKRRSNHDGGTADTGRDHRIEIAPDWLATRARIFSSLDVDGDTTNPMQTRPPGAEPPHRPGSGRTLLTSVWGQFPVADKSPANGDCKDRILAVAELARACRNRLASISRACLGCVRS